MSIEPPNQQTTCLPERMFASGEEPTGERVNSYHKPKSIDAILSALNADEIDFLRRSKFGKLIATSEKPSFSGSFGQYMITRMLKVSKKHDGNVDEHDDPTIQQPVLPIQVENESSSRQLANEIIANIVGDIGIPPQSKVNVDGTGVPDRSCTDGGIENLNNQTENVPRADNAIRRSTRNRSEPSQLVDYQVGAKRRKVGREVTFNLLGEDTGVDYAAKFSVLRRSLTKNSIICIGNGTSVNGDDVVVIADRSTFLPTKVMDALMSYTSDLFEKIYPRPNDSRVDFFDTKFASHLHKQHSKFTRTAVKDKRKFHWPEAIVDYFGLDDDEPPTFHRIYFPFNVDKTHWVGVCVDPGAGSIDILDCNTAKRSDRAMKQDLTPLSQLLPYIFKRNVDSVAEEKPLTITRAKGIPQTAESNDSGLMSELLIHAHSVAGTDGCKWISTEALAEEAVKLAVLFYEEYAQAD